MSSKKSRLLGLETGARSSPVLEKCCLLLAANESFQNAERDIELLMGIKVGHSSQHRCVQVSLAGIARVLNLEESWLQAYVNKQYQAVPRTVEIIPKPKGKLIVQMDELWSFVDNKGNKQWVWLAIDAKTREIIGCQIGDRSQASAQLLWDSLPSVYRQCAKIYTDFWAAYSAVLSSRRHTAVGKETGLTSLIERLNHTFRQRVSRLVRKTLPFAKKLENHIGAIWNFIHDYNSNIRAAIIQNKSDPLFSPSFT